MNSAELAAQLVSSKNKRQRKSLISKHIPLIGTDLARAIKDICVQNWTTEPQVVRATERVLRDIAEIDSQPEMQAFTAWVSGMAEISRGKLESALTCLEQAAKLFSATGNVHESAQPRVASLIALAMLSRYNEATAAGRRALRIFEKFGDELAAGKVEKNLSNIASRRGRHRKAEELGLSAYSRFVKLKEKGEQAMAENSLAITYTEINDFRSAERYFAAALKTARSSEMLVTQAEIEASMGNLALARGRYAESLNFLEISRRKYDELHMPHQTAVAELEIADIYAELNLTAEALDLYASVTEKLRKLKMRTEEARARSNYGKAAIKSKKAAFSRKQFKRAFELYELEKNQTGTANVLLNLAYLEMTIGNHAEAGRLARKAGALFKRTNNARQRLAASWLTAEVLSKGGKYARSVSILEHTLSDALKLEHKQAALLALNSMGKLAVRSGDSTKATKLFKQAIAITEHTRAPLAGEEFRMAFLDGKLEPYENLVKIYLSEKKFRDAFLYVEKGRSRALLESIGNEPAATNIQDEFGRRAERLREDLNWYYGRAARTSPEAAKALSAKIRKSERELSTVLRRVESTRKIEPESRGKSSKGIDIPNLQAHLGSTQALIEFVNIDGILSAFVLTDSKFEYFPDLASENEIYLLLEQLRFQFGTLRYGRKALGSFAAQLTQRAKVNLNALHEKLVRPFEKSFQDRDLVIVPAGVLHYVPFNALYDTAHYLIESRSITHSPAASIWQTLASKEEPKFKQALLIGFADESAPQVENEVLAIKEIFPTAKCFTGDQATFSNFRDNAAKSDVIHLACHGQFRADNPLYSSLHLADGRITVRDVAQQRLSARHVSLSACETGLSKVFAGEEIIGLARGFLSAGVRSILLSLWTVNDEATMRLMTAFYANLQRGCTISASLRLAQINFIEQGEHPYYWAPFILIG